MRTPWFAVVASLALACGTGDDTGPGEDSGVATLGSSGAGDGGSASDDGSTTGGETETGGPVGDEYRDCQDVFDCPEGTLYACLSKVSEGHVCAPSCDTHADCPPPPPGGAVTPACTTVDGRQRCLLAGCQSNDDCPTGMVCHIEGPNWCHWPV